MLVRLGDVGFAVGLGTVVAVGVVVLESAVSAFSVLNLKYAFEVNLFVHSEMSINKKKGHLL
jgi:hypothetical protein